MTESHYEIGSINVLQFSRLFVRKEVINHQGSDRGNAGNVCAEIAAFKTS